MDKRCGKYAECIEWYVLQTSARARPVRAISSRLHIIKKLKGEHRDNGRRARKHTAGGYVSAGKQIIHPASPYGMFTVGRAGRARAAQGGAVPLQRSRPRFVTK
ncbi:hypothetical protein EVAR_11217_1 [Eumeta japonica]|uniref:Uncharacterized protein n=1 Tax=Eumeta variegata TaxID=151549 RepID=A0A4C1U5R1_EUMVA|nr:hypothetical protein EVAR_11217_1 [Eumeta japonica]